MPCRLGRSSSVILRLVEFRSLRAKRSNPASCPATRKLDCFVASLLAMTPDREKKMGKVKAAAFSVSLDGYGAGPAQDINNPLGVGGMQVHDWMRGTQMFHKMTGQEGGSTGVDNDFA